MTKKRKIILIGFMGTGKSLVGQALAKHIGFGFADMDERIVQKAGMSIPEIFAAHDEAFFRDVESAVLLELATSGQLLVISTGGGAVLREENRRIMLEHGYVIALQANAETIIARVKGDANRPLLQGDVSERVHRLLAERASAYDFAHVTIDTNTLTAEDIVRIIDNEL